MNVTILDREKLKRVYKITFTGSLPFTDEHFIQSVTYQGELDQLYHL